MTTSKEERMKAALKRFVKYLDNDKGGKAGEREWVSICDEARAVLKETAGKEERLKAARAELDEASRAWEKANRTWNRADRARDDAFQAWNEASRKIRAIEEEP